jgi:hypothetical protein
MADRIEFYTDEHVARAVVRGLRKRGVDVLTATEADMLAATDEKHFDLATRLNRVIFTQDDDFLRLASDRHEHAGVVYAAQHTPVGSIVAGLIMVHQVLTPEEMRNHTEYL